MSCKARNNHQWTDKTTVAQVVGEKALPLHFGSFHQRLTPKLYTRRENNLCFENTSDEEGPNASDNK